MKARFDAEGIYFSGYPFWPASIGRRGTLEYSSIRDVDPQAAPPEVRTHRGETLFISAVQVDDFQLAITRHRLTLVHRPDIWHLLLEPFLDTQFDRAHQKQTLATLASHGIPRREAKKIRGSVARRMYADNSIMWEWVHLGLLDVLLAKRPQLDVKSLFARLFPERFEQFYWKAMEIADRPALVT